MTWRVLAFFLCLTLLLRLPALWVSVIDHDESTYIVIANELLKGKTLYVQLCDTKPPGIFLIFAAVIAVFGKSVLAIRLCACMAIALTAWLLYLAKRRLSSSVSLAVCTGIAYILATAIHRWGLSGNTELFFNLFTALAWYQTLKIMVVGNPIKADNVSLIAANDQANCGKIAIIGALFGVGFIIKYVALFDFIAWAMVILAYRLYQTRTLRTLFATATQMLPAAIAFTLPFFACWAWFYTHGYSSHFYEAAFEITRRYPNHFEWGRSAELVGRFLLVYCPLVIGACLTWYYALRHRLPHYAPFAAIALPICLFCAILATILTGKAFSHYLLQPLLPLAFWSIDGCWVAAAGNRLVALRETNKNIVVTDFTASNMPKKNYLALFFALCCFVIVVLNVVRCCIKPDVRREIAAYIAPRLQLNDQIYTPAATILYAWLDRSPLSCYVHASLLTKPDHIRALQIDPDAEFAVIVAQQPRFVVIDNPQHPLLEAYLRNACHLVSKYEGNIRLYERNEYPMMNCE